MTVMRSVRLCAVEELAEGAARGFDPWQAGHDTVFVVRGAGCIRAWRDACPHVDGAPMAWRKDAYLNAARNRIVCSGHGAEFDVDTGVCVLGPCLGQSLQPFEVRTMNGVLYADLAGG